MMKFELLPNEILFECFKYLNSLDIFYSFDQLNDRLNKLIRDIPLCLNFENIPQSIFIQFCTNILSNQELKKQIYSLHLSNKDTCWQIRPFLTHFSLNEFVNLRSLTLTEITKMNVSQLKPMLPSILQLSCFRMIDYRDNTNEILSALQISQLRTLMLSYFPTYSRFVNDISSIINLTIDNCTPQELFTVLTNTSRLKYLKVETINPHYVITMNNDESSINDAIHLKKLIIMSICGTFSDLILILKKTPNLTNLTIGVFFKDSTHNACQWKDFITSSLPYLKSFKFKFQCYIHYNGKDAIEENFKQFQNDFWHKQHHWYTEYEISNNSASIYTIPYISNIYNLNSCTGRSCNWLLNNVNYPAFDSFLGIDNSQYYLAHVSFLVIGNLFRSVDKWLLQTKDIESLKLIMNLSNVKNLSILDSCTIKTPSILLEILQEMPQTSSIIINSNLLISLLSDDQLCKCLNKMIKRLTMTQFTNSDLNDADELKVFCKIFSNLEQLTCAINYKDFWLLMIKYLPKLLRLNVYSNTSNRHDELSWLEEEVSKLGFKMFAEIIIQNDTNLSIWIIRDMF